MGDEEGNNMEKMEDMTGYVKSWVQRTIFGLEYLTLPFLAVRLGFISAI